jgi:FAD/FMN-containing dehydrogenase
MTAVDTAGNAVPDGAVKEFGNALAGGLLLPGDAGYDEARKVWNGMIDRRPGLIARCADATDVVRAVNFGRDHGLLVAVRGGGHSFPGLSVCDGGMLIDLSPMKGITIDAARRRARVEPGVVWGELDGATQEFGLAVTGGMISHTGVAGLTLGGGLGWLMRRYGLTCDNLVAADVVTADGESLTASATENPDLFWGLRGGGGNFGVVTSFEYQLHRVGAVFGGLVAYPLTEALAVLRGWREWVADAPDELTSVVSFLTSPEGHPAVGIALCFAGEPEVGERVVQPIRRLGTVALEQLGPMRYPDLQSMLDDAAVPRHRYYVRGNSFPAVSDEMVGVLAECYRQVPSPLTQMLLYRFGGAVGRVAPEATAFPHRDAKHYLEIFNAWTDPSSDGENVAWMGETWEAVRPFLGRGVYVNHLERGEGTDRVREAYGVANYERLEALKNKYDPTNFFRLNQNIKPRA